MQDWRENTPEKSPQYIEISETSSRFELTQSLLNEFLDHNKALSFIKDAAGRYVYVNRSFLEFFRVKAENILGKTDFEWLPEQLAHQFTENDNHVRTTGETLEVIESVPSDHGVIRSLVCKFLIADKAGNKCVGGIALDVSKRLEAEELKGQLAAIVDSSHDAILASSPEGIIRTCNRSAERIFGYRTDEMVGQHLNILVPKENVHYVEQILLRLKMGDDVVHREGECLLKDGQIIYISVTASPIRDAMGVITGVSFVARDMSRRREMEQVLRQTSSDLAVARDQALESSSLKSAFVATISHELRTPLSAILGMAELLSYTEMTEEQQAFLQILDDSAKSLLGIVSDILDLSKIEAGKLALEHVPFNLIFLAQECARTLSASAKAKGLFLKTQIDQGMPQFVMGDPGRVRQTLINLIGNSIKFTETGGITVEVATVSEDRNTIYIRFSVTDTGIGIAEKDQRLLFKPFTQVDGSHARKYSGTGLGLSISKELVEMMDGTIGVESMAGMGTTFWFLIPFKMCGQPSDSETKYDSDNPTFSKNLVGKLILVVEDSPVLQNLIIKQLETGGIKAHAVASGMKAIEKIKNQDFDLILMDCQLPELDGYSATVAIRQLESTSGRRIPIIALTAGAMDSDREKCINAGMDDYLSKPTNIRQLFDKLESWICLSERQRNRP